METPLSQIMDNNLVPFIDNIDASSIMTAHVIFKDIDKDYPSTLSEKVIKGILLRVLGCVANLLDTCKRQLSRQHGLVWRNQY